MAVTPIAIARELMLIMDNGVSASGQPVTINRTFKNVKMSSSDEALHDVAEVIVSLQTQENVSIQRRDVHELYAE